MKSKLAGMLAEKRVTEEQIKKVKVALGMLGNVQGLAMAAGDAATRLNSFIYQRGGGSAMQIPERLKGELRDLEERKEKAVNVLKAAREKEQKLRDELSELQGRLAGFDCRCSEEEVLGYQKDLTAAKQKAGDLIAAITHQETIIRAAEVGVPSMGGLLQEREDLLANIATGAATAEALESLDERIKGRKMEVDDAVVETKKIADQARQTIAGLRRKLAEAEAEVANIQGELLPAAIAGFLQSRAEVAGEEYMVIAEELFMKLGQIVGLGALFKKIAGKEISLSWDWSQFRSPGFALKSCEGFLSDRVIACFGTDGANLEAAAQTEAQKIRELGINL